jgi:hypothetical protein
VLSRLIRESELEGPNTSHSVSADYVLSRLIRESELEGPNTSHSARVRALELLGKHLLLFPDRVHHDGDGKPLVAVNVVNTGELTDDKRHERLQILAERIRQRRLGVVDAGGESAVGSATNGASLHP